jgi:hypothetical protein
MRSPIPRGSVLALWVSVYIKSVSVAFAGPFEDALAACDRREYGAALQLMWPMAEKGNGEAQNGIGAFYYHG